ncbi:unnamed protein product [Meganyctiphanes norvegica]|uniref:Uncharacterized protein n=1 Tax=Meganyctiphanes norvegica TaxID=48144 RepID=A0AAV2SCW1_MEGNR
MPKKGPKNLCLEWAWRLKNNSTLSCCVHLQNTIGTNFMVLSVELHSQSSCQLQAWVFVTIFGMFFNFFFLEDYSLEPLEKFEIPEPKIKPTKMHNFGFRDLRLLSGF